MSAFFTISKTKKVRSEGRAGGSETPDSSCETRAKFPGCWLSTSFDAESWICKS